VTEHTDTWDWTAPLSVAHAQQRIRAIKIEIRSLLAVVRDWSRTADEAAEAGRRITVLRAETDALGVWIAQWC
jgi:hypothetical protein